MKDFSLPTYDEPRKWIVKCRANKEEWDVIRLGKKNSENELAGFLSLMVDVAFWPELTVDEWYNLVDLQKQAEEDTKKIDLIAGIAQIVDAAQDNAVSIPMSPASSWQLYRSKLEKNGFKPDTINEIERTTLKILKRLNNNTTESGPVKGLVIGNVQSGKTANMAALMAMAADWGWNMFIILSGTIENLRVQTQNRLFNDLNQQGTIFWRSFEHLEKNVDIAMRTQSLHFDADSKERYFTVCLKNSTRLRKLIQWAQADKNKQKQMKILVIDDEADQASVNTSKVDIAERKNINKLICALVNGQNEKGENIPTKYQAMNYIGYTATPYANVLNEKPGESLYPKNFITTLAVSKEYFGPQQIFGYLGDSVSFEGMDIVRVIEDEQLEEIKAIHDGNTSSIPKSLESSLCWFMCGVACMRIWGYKKPISMLVHTSQKTWHHSNVATVINDWFKNNSVDDIIAKIKKVWDSETSQFTFEKFREEYPEYDRKDEEINRYPSFDEIETQVRYLLSVKVSNIELGADNELSYHHGIHLCIDNCTYSGITADQYHVRLAYPEANKMPSPAPAFIVIGGATLSRGLTIEGLISTYFLRTVGQADTLMQMGRWFGYRKNYELLPRVWVTQKTNEQFKFLAALDQELRDEIQFMDVNGRSPSEYGPKVKNSPKTSFIRITSKNKMQMATEAEMDYSGASNQTILFDNNASVLDANIALAEQFILSLGKCWSRTDGLEMFGNHLVWKNVPFQNIKTFINAFNFQERMRVFNDTTPLLKWIEEMTKNGRLDNWNVIVAGKQDSSNGVWEIGNGLSVNKVNRSRKITNSELTDVINIGALRAAKDMLADIDLNDIDDLSVKNEVEVLLKDDSISKKAPLIRDKAGLKTIPQLLIYRVDANSKTLKDSATREDLGAKSDLIGLCLYIPGGRVGTSYATSVSIKMDNDIFDGGADLEGTDEN